MGEFKLKHGLSVVGILASTAGLLERPVRFRDLTMDNIDSDLLREGGTMLETINKGPHVLHAVFTTGQQTIDMNAQL